MEKMQSRAITEKVSKGKLMNESGQGRSDGNEVTASATAGIYSEKTLCDTTCFISIFYYYGRIVLMLCRRHQNTDFNTG